MECLERAAGRDRRRRLSLGSGYFSHTTGPICAYEQAAAAQRVRVFSVSVGGESDPAAMDRIASVGNGEHHHVEGSIEQYSAQLDQIRTNLG